MRLDELYRFEDPTHYKGFVQFNEISISLLELEVQRIRANFEIIKRQTTEKR